MIPLAERMRPKNLDQYIGQEHLVSKGSILYNIIESGSIPSFILWGPPGVGKTTLASIISNSMNRPFFALSAINSGVKDVREVIEKASSTGLFNNRRPILFIDEIHRFSKSQQDSLLNAVEKGIITLIGATTENPSFEVIPALLSRCQVYILNHLSNNDMKRMVDQAVERDEILSTQKIKIKSYDAIIRLCGGDGRKLYNILELVTSQFKKDDEIIIDDEMVTKIIQNNLVVYDKNGEMHYDLISAFIKSVRGSNPDAALYYMARMLQGGEDPLFICRRMIILAAEDIGLANPNALLIANACFQSVHQIGMPEARIIMSEAAIYLACSPKSNTAYIAIDSAMREVNETGNLSVPLHLRNASTKLMKDLNYGKDYKYAHDYEDNFVDYNYFPEGLKLKEFYQPGNNSQEDKNKEIVKKNRGEN
jgi:putative ATPase